MNKAPHLTEMPAFSIAFAVPPEATSLNPKADKPSAKLMRPVLSDTLSKAMGSIL